MQRKKVCSHLLHNNINVYLGASGVVEKNGKVDANTNQDTILKLPEEAGEEGSPQCQLV